MELKHLRSFVAVAEQLSFVRAAEQLHLSQPALSEQIQRLEEYLGVQLLKRNRRTVSLTDPGRVFLSEARATLARAEQAVERVQKAQRGQIGRLRVGFVSSAALELVPAIAQAFRRQYPEVTLDLMNVRTSSQLTMLVGKTMDVGFLRMPASHQELAMTVIHREPFVVVLPTDHRLARKRRLDLNQLEDEPFVAYGRKWAPGFFDTVMQMCTSNGFSPRIVQETGEMYTAIALVGSGAGVAILPQSVVLAQSRNVVMKPLPLAAGASLMAVAVRRSDCTPLARAFVSMAITVGERSTKSGTV